MSSFAIYALVCAGVTYLIRMIPLVAVKKKIKNRFLLSFLHYVPYAVLSVMTVPAIFYSTASVISAAVGFLIALLLSWREKGLMTVASLSCGAVFIAELIMRFV